MLFNEGGERRDPEFLTAVCSGLQAFNIALGELLSPEQNYICAKFGSHAAGDIPGAL